MGFQANQGVSVCLAVQNFQNEKYISKCPALPGNRARITPVGVKRFTTALHPRQLWLLMSSIDLLTGRQPVQSADRHFLFLYSTAVSGQAVLIEQAACQSTTQYHS